MVFLNQDPKEGKSIPEQPTSWTPQTGSSTRPPSVQDDCDSKKPSHTPSRQQLLKDQTTEKQDGHGDINGRMAVVDLAASPEDGHRGQGDYVHGITLFFILLALTLSVFLSALDLTIVATAVPKITDEFHGLAQAAWYGSAYFLTDGGFQSSWGKAYKYFPLKFAFLTAVCVFEIGSLICATSPNSTAFIIGRAINGLGAAGIATGSYTIIAFVAEPSKRAAYTSITGSSYGMASILGPLLGGVFADKVTWRWCFYINLPIGGVAATIIVFFFKNPASAKPVEASWGEKAMQLDLVGVFLVMGLMVCYLLALQNGGQDHPWNSSIVVGLLVGCVLLTIVFAAWEWYIGERAMLVPRLFRNRVICVNSAFTFFFSGSYFLSIYYLPIYFQAIDGIDPIMSGVRNLPLILACTVAIISSGVFISATGHAVPVEVVGSALATIGCGLIYTLDVGSSSGKWIGYQIIAGAGWGLAFQVPVILTQAACNKTPKDISSASSTILVFQCLAGSFFISAAQSAFVNNLILSLPKNAPGVTAMKVMNTGSAELRNVFPSEVLPGVVRSYMDGLKIAFAISLAASGVSFLFTVMNRWHKINKEEDTKTTDSDTS
ncbi:Uncharacterized protein TCAP_00109 [Tolypocladium capitatum]|uniref:Major facilitator superfamily (MFS) profile domain-containing protein n=1 Tax=Tolypocladium capitatum TaxID=45235 RepID=A0A2K3QR35_9HYPO|nr:Uncharacterized protein TCAP_00109 [Tolypocladium capitatum]